MPCREPVKRSPATQRAEAVAGRRVPRMKPTSRKCATCRHGNLTPVTLDYTTEMEHDGRAYCVSIKGLDLLRCDKCDTLVLPDKAYEKLAEALRYQAGLLMPSQIAAKREELRLSQKDFAHLLGV